MGKLTGHSLIASMANSLNFSRSHSHAFSSSSSSPNSDPALLKFEAGLTEGLYSLRTSCTHDRASANLNWLLDALAVANSTQTLLISHVLPQLTESKEALLQHLESAVGLLDVCKPLKDAIAHIQDYLARIQKAVKHFSQELRSRSRQSAALRLQTCLARLEAGNRKRWQFRLEDACNSLKIFKKQMMKTTIDAQSSNLMHLVDEATMTIAVIMSALASSFSSAPKVQKKPITRTNSCNVVSGMRCLLSSGPLKSLQKDLAHEDTCGTVFQELEGLHAAVLGLLHVAHEPVIAKLAAEALIKKARETELSLAELSPKLDGLFHAMSAARLHALS